jgi:hypothetical protein
VTTSKKNSPKYRLLPKATVGSTSVICSIFGICWPGETNQRQDFCDELALSYCMNIKFGIFFFKIDNLVRLSSCMVCNTSLPALCYRQHAANQGSKRLACEEELHANSVIAEVS